MSVTIDHQPLAARDLGLQTVGQVLAHVAKDNRLVVQVLIDGQEPDITHLGRVRATPIDGRTIFIETANSAELAIDVLDEVVDQLIGAEQSKQSAADFLQQGQTSKALCELGVCIRAWQHAQQSIVKVLELLRVNPADVTVSDQPLELCLENFSLQLHQVKSSLEQRDFVSLGDTLLYETADTTQSWLSCIDAVRQLVQL
ncbi:MAG TPA: hypothetical protein VGQ99_23625 [Tepidisphaeraceae bacterium]|jgi:hypothetical protein|nr:hypothetical protein [Tepidisphaeraceae bacterium]